MINLINYLNIVGPTAIVLVSLVFVAEVIKAGKVVFEFIAAKVLKIKTKSAKKKEKEEQIQTLILQNNLDLQKFISDQGTYNTEIKDEIADIRKDMKRSLEDISNEMQASNEEIRNNIDDLKTGFNEISNTVTDMQLEAMRETILEFASALSSPNGNIYTKEQFLFVKKTYKNYMNLITSKNKTNDEVDLSMIIINNKYEYNVLHHTFLEDIAKNPDIKHDIDEQIEKSKITRKSKKKSVSKSEVNEDETTEADE